MLFVACQCALLVVCCLLRGECCVLRCVLFGVCRGVACRWLLRVVYCMLCVVCWLCVACCLLCDVSCLLRFGRCVTCVVS